MSGYGFAVQEGHHSCHDCLLSLTYRPQIRQSREPTTSAGSPRIGPTHLPQDRLRRAMRDARPGARAEYELFLSLSHGTRVAQVELIVVSTACDRPKLTPWVQRFQDAS